MSFLFTALHHCCNKKKQTKKKHGFINLRKYLWISNMCHLLLDCHLAAEVNTHTLRAKRCKWSTTEDGFYCCRRGVGSWVLSNMGLINSSCNNPTNSPSPVSARLYPWLHDTPTTHYFILMYDLFGLLSRSFARAVGVGSRGAVWTSFFLTDTTARLLGNNRVSHQENRSRSR